MFLWQYPRDKIDNDIQYSIRDDTEEIMIKKNKSDFDFIISNPEFKILIDSIGTFQRFSYIGVKHISTGNFYFGLFIYFDYEPDLYAYEERYPLDFIVDEHTVIRTDW